MTVLSTMAYWKQTKNLMNVYKCCRRWHHMNSRGGLSKVQSSATQKNLPPFSAANRACRYFSSSFQAQQLCLGGVFRRSHLTNPSLGVSPVGGQADKKHFSATSSQNQNGKRKSSWFGFDTGGGGLQTTRPTTSHQHNTTTTLVSSKQISTAEATTKKHTRKFVTAVADTSAPVRIGCASGFWGDTPTAVEQLVRHGKLDFLVMDYLAEVTMSLLAAAKAKNENLGWCPDFVQTVGPFLSVIKDKELKVVANAGGMNPFGCMQAMMMVASKSGMSDKIKVAVVSGDDLIHTKSNITKEKCPSPSTIASINAYLGAGPIARALDLGADIVITGRCTDSALALGPLVHKYKWSWDDFDMLASGSLAGHLIECGAQATGGIFTDWEQVDGWESNGFPIAVCESNGKFLLTKPKGTGGLVSRGTVGEQLLYEIGDPCRYVLPDVICDFSNVQLQERKDGVYVQGAKGIPPTPFYKAGGTFQDGWKCTAVCPLIGPKAREKGHKTAQAILARSSALFKMAGLPDFLRTHVQILGSEEAYGSNARQANLEVRDAVIWISVHHEEKKALEMFAREVASAGTGMAPGLTTVVSGRPKASPLLRFFSYLYDKQELPITIKMSDGYEETYQLPSISATSAESLQNDMNRSITLDSPRSQKDEFSYRLRQLAFTRSGDKGNHCNIGVMARKPEYYPILLEQLTEETVADYFSHKFTKGIKVVKRYEVPGIHGINFVLENSLGGGGIAALNPDPQGKGYGEMLSDFQIFNVSKLINE